MNINAKRRIKALLSRTSVSVLRGLCHNAGIDTADTKRELVSDLAAHYDAWYDNEYAHVVAAIRDVERGWSP